MSLADPQGLLVSRSPAIAAFEALRVFSPVDSGLVLCHQKVIAESGSLGVGFGICYWGLEED